MRISDENVQFQRKINKHIKYDTLNDNCRLDKTLTTKIAARSYMSYL